MDLHIMGLADALMHRPTKRTYVIRIGERGLYPLRKSRLYTVTTQYSFDDIWPGCEIQGLMFDEGLARRVLEGFDEKRQECEALLVHCARGINRSPAVGIALNEVFQLGHNSPALKERYPEANWYVYNTLKETARKLAIPKSHASSYAHSKERIKPQG